VPTYDYRCGVCGHRVEVVHGLHAHGPKVCPSCGAEGSMRKLLSAPTIVFKGSGWAKKDRAATAAPGKTQADKAAETASREDGSAEKKPGEPKQAKAEASPSGSTGD
jgi:putative FmdB family regulatory protein